MREPSWCESLRWNLHSLSDWFSIRHMWRTSVAIDRCALGIYRLFNQPAKGTSMTASVNLLQHLQLLGLRVEDRVTGFKGVVASVTFDLYGCIQGIVNPGTGNDGKLMDSQWFDVNRLRVLDPKPVMERPHFEWTPEATSAGRKGPAERPRTGKA